MKALLNFLFLFLIPLAWGQGIENNTQEQNVLRVIEDFNRHLENRDTLLAQQLVYPSSYLSRIQLNDEELIRKEQNVHSLAQSHWSSKRYLHVPQVDIRSTFASVYGYFTAFGDDGGKKCGTDHYQLILSKQGWKVIEYTETTYDKCKSIVPPKKELELINRTLNQWHGLAAVGDTSYFDYFGQGSFYLGTDPKEVWSLQEFKDFALPHFRRGSAWNFKNKNRNIHLGDYGHYAWFDETLDTWMGLCRGTGVMEKQSDGWKIKHYSLTVLVSNKIINDYIKLLKIE